MRKKKKGNIFKQGKESIESFFSDKRIKNLFGISFIFVGIFLFASFTSFLFNGHNDQDKIGQFSNVASCRPAGTSSIGSPRSP